MRTFFLNAAAAAMMFTTPAVLPAPAQAAPVTDLRELCESIIAPAPQPRNRATLGECTSFFRLFDLEKDGLPTLVCDFWLESGQLEDFGYESFDECVIGEHEFFNG